jgi:hypothetical protein
MRLFAVIYCPKHWVSGDHSMRNETKRIIKIILWIAGGVASPFILGYACLLLAFFGGNGLERLGAHFIYKAYQTKINRISYNKITDFSLDGRGDWDPYTATMALRTKNNYDVTIGLVGPVQGAGRCFTLGIMNKSNGRRYESLYFSDHDEEIKYGSNAIKSARNFRDLDDFIIRSDSIVTSLAHTIDTTYPTP